MCIGKILLKNLEHIPTYIKYMFDVKIIGMILLKTKRNSILEQLEKS